MAAPVEDLTGVVWRHDDWLRCYPLTYDTALHYFELSPFYDRSSVNETLRKWHEPMTEENLIKRGPGLEFVVQDAQEPHLFVIRRQVRKGPKNTDMQTAYYILDGNIYQAPTMHAAISSRMDRSLHNMKVAFSKMQQDLDPLHQDMEDSAAEALQSQADAFRRKPLSAAEQELVKRTDRIIMNVLSQHSMPKSAAGQAPSGRQPGAAQLGLESQGTVAGALANDVKHQSASR